MAQVIATKPKPKRCNKAALTHSLYDIVLKYGEYMLVSSDNSMDIDGDGNFDCYIVGDGVTPCQRLPLRKLEDDPYLSTTVRSITSADIDNWNSKADDNAVVHLDNKETITAQKVFSAPIVAGVVKSGNFVSGQSGFKLQNDSQTGKSSLEVDNLNVRNPYKYFLRVSPQVVNTDTHNNKYIVVTAYKQFATGAPEQLSSTDGFAIYVSETPEVSGGGGGGMIIRPTQYVSTSGTLSFKWKKTCTYSDIILYDKDPRFTMMGEDEAQEYDRIKLTYVSNGQDGTDGEDGADGQPGANGTSFIVKGYVSGYYDDIQDIPSGYFSDGEKVLVDNNPLGEYAVLTLDNGQWVDDTPSAGDAYIQTNDEQTTTYNHLFCANGTEWVDLGAIQGPAGRDGRDGTDGTDGTDGVDAVLFYASKNPIVVEEYISSGGYSWNNETHEYDHTAPTYSYRGLPTVSDPISFYCKIGDTEEQATIEEIGLGSGEIIGNGAIQHDGTYLYISDLLGKGDQAKREGSFYVQLSCTIDEVEYTATIEVRIYVNRTGTWAHTIQGDVSKSYSEAQWYVGEQGFLTSASEIVQSATGVSIATLLDGIFTALFKVEHGQITLKSNNIVQIIADNAVDIITPFINAITSEIIAKALTTISPDGLMQIKIEDGKILVYYKGVLRLEIGLAWNDDEEDLAPAIIFYDAHGNPYSRLGQEGHTKGWSQQARVLVWQIKQYGLYTGDDPGGAYDNELYRLIQEKWNYIWDNIGTETDKLYQPWLNCNVPGVSGWSFPVGNWPAIAFEGSAPEEISITTTGATPGAALDKKWIPTTNINDQMLSEGLWLVVGRERNYEGNTAPNDYYDYWYGEYAISDWSNENNNIKVRSFAFIKDGEIAPYGKINVYNKVV